MISRLSAPSLVLTVSTLGDGELLVAAARQLDDDGPALVVDVDGHEPELAVRLRNVLLEDHRRPPGSRRWRLVLVAAATQQCEDGDDGTGKE